jgi:hypothetical protein
VPRTAHAVQVDLRLRNARKLKAAMKTLGEALPVLLDPRPPESIKSIILNSLLVDSLHLPRPFATVLAQEVKTLGALDRYRALSRRKFAIRALDAAGAARDQFPR